LTAASPGCIPADAVKFGKWILAGKKTGRCYGMASQPNASLRPKTKLYITTVNRPGAPKKFTMAASRPATAEDPIKLLRLQALKLPAAGKAVVRNQKKLPTRGLKMLVP
jgi:hypothetical protein